jgi:hypothetical protein
MICGLASKIEQISIPHFWRLALAKISFRILSESEPFRTSELFHL